MSHLWHSFQKGKFTGLSSDELIKHQLIYAALKRVKLFM